MGLHSIIIKKANEICRYQKSILALKKQIECPRKSKN